MKTKTTTTIDKGEEGEKEEDEEIEHKNDELEHKNDESSIRMTRFGLKTD